MERVGTKVESEKVGQETQEVDMLTKVDRVLNDHNREGSVTYTLYDGKKLNKVSEFEFEEIRRMVSFWNNPEPDVDYVPQEIYYDDDYTGCDDDKRFGKYDCNYCGWGIKEEGYCSDECKERSECRISKVKRAC